MMTSSITGKTTEAKWARRKLKLYWVSSPRIMALPAEPDDEFEFVTLVECSPEFVNASRYGG